MSNQSLISIIIPLYNKEEYFERCFNSVTKQIYKNIECIIVEDCSTDNSLKIAAGLINNYQGNIKFNLIKHDKNGGLSAARNTGINNSSGSYVYFLDSDDEITDNCILSLANLISKYPDADIVQGNLFQSPRVQNDKYNLKGRLPEYINDNLKIKKKYYITNRLPANSVNKLIKKSFITDNHLYFKPGLVHEDYHWLFFAVKKLKSFAFTEDFCYIRYFVPGSIMTNPNLSGSISGYLCILNDMLNNLDNDLLEYQLSYIYFKLKQQKKIILSDPEYSQFLPECNRLLKKMPKGLFFIHAGFSYDFNKIKCFLRNIINK